MDQLKDLFPLIYSYAREKNMRSVSRSWYHALSMNDRLMLNTLYTRYGNGYTPTDAYLDSVADVQELLEKAVEAGDIDTVESFAYEYTRYLPVSWIKLHGLRHSYRMREIVVSRCSDWLENARPWGQKDVISMTCDEFKQYLFENGPDSQKEISDMAYILILHKRYDLVDIILLIYPEVHKHDNRLIQTVWMLYFHVRGIRSNSYIESILADNPSLAHWNDETLKIYIYLIMKMDAVSIVLPYIHTGRIYRSLICRFSHGKILSKMRELHPDLLLQGMTCMEWVVPVNDLLRTYVHQDDTNRRNLLLAALVQGCMDILVRHRNEIPNIIPHLSYPIDNGDVIKFLRRIRYPIRYFSRIFSRNVTKPTIKEINYIQCLYPVACKVLQKKIKQKIEWYLSHPQEEDIQKRLNDIKSMFEH